MPRNSRYSVLAVLLTLVAATGIAVAQPGLAEAGTQMRRVQDALLKGQRDEAARLLADLRIPPESSPDHARVVARKALLQAGCAKDDDRIGKYIAVAGSYAERSEGLTALLAALHHIRMVVDDDDSLILEDYPEEGPNSLPVQLSSCRQLLAPWLARAADDPRVQSAARLLESAAADSSPIRPSLIRLGSRTPIPVVTPLAEPLIVRWYARSSESQPDADIREGTVAPLDERRIPADTRVPPLPTPPAGAYVLEVRSPSGWRVLRRVVLSDLDLAVQMVPKGLVVLATHDGKPAAGITLTLGTVDRRRRPFETVTTDERGLAIVALDEDRRGTVVVDGVMHTPDGGVHRCQARSSNPGRHGTTSRWTAHVMVDRPLYRPGETVHGRIVVRRHREHLTDALIDRLSTPESSPAAGLGLDLEVTLPGNKKQKLALKTDDFGVASFTTEIPKGSSLGSIRYHFRRDKETLLDTRPASVSAFKRPPILVDLEGPTLWTKGTKAPRATVSAVWPWGTPAAGLAGTVRATINGFPHHKGFTLDTDGRATIDLDLPGLSALEAGQHVSASIEVRAADGQVMRKSWGVSVKRPESSATHTARIDQTRIRLDGPNGRITAGDPAEVRVTGPANQAVLVTVARETLVSAHAVVLSPQGRATVRLQTQPHWTPHVTVVASLPRPASGGSDGQWYRTARATIQIRRPEHRMSVVLERDKDVYGPGERSEWSIVTRDGNGKGVPSTVAISVVDDTLFQLASDRTRNPLYSLKPGWWAVAVRYGFGPRRGDPWRTISELLWAGKVPKPTWEQEWNDAIGLGGGAGSAFGGRGGGAGGKGGSSTRKNFKTTAHWIANLRTDANGKATFDFAFPDDLTTWRVTAAVVDAGRGGALHVERVRTEKPVATEAILPRLLREGDRLDVPVQVAQARGESFDATVNATAKGGAHVDEDPFVIRTTPGASVSRTVSVKASESDEVAERDPTTFTSVVSRASDGVPLDRAVRSLPVTSRDVIKTTAATSIVRGKAVIAPEILTGARPRGIEVEVLGSIDAVLAQAGRYLTGYPWGCAEQTTSRMVPIIVSAHARLTNRAPGEARLDPRQAHRLEIGMARLRELQRSDGGFSWWDGGKTDPGISAMVLRTLTLMRDAGIDPTAYRVRHSHDLKLLDQATRACVATSKPDIGPFPAGAIAHLVMPGHAPFDDTRERALAAVELAVTRVLIGARTAAALAPLEGVLAHAERLPLGLVARTGRAFAIAGFPDKAVRVLDVVRRRIEVTGGIGSGPNLDESASIRAAAVLELVLATAPKDPLKDRVLSEILRLNRAGRIDHTAGSAASIIALARLRAAEPGSFTGAAETPFTVTVTCAYPDGESVATEETLGAEEGYAGSWSFDDVVGPVTIEAPAGRMIVATAVARFATDGTTVKPWSTPLSVHRRLFRVTRDENGRESRTLVDDGHVAVGDVLEVELEIIGPPATRYLLAECPVPAGFEAIQHRRGVVIHDDRVARGLSRLSGGRQLVTFRLIPALTGRVAWPAARVEAMYRPEHTGGSDGGWLTVRKRRPPSGPAGRAELLGSDWARTQLDHLIGEVRHEISDKKTSNLLQRIAKVPTTAARSWLLEEAPGILGPRLLDREVMRGWLESIDRAQEERLSGARLEALFEAVDVDRDRLIAALAKGFHRTHQVFHEARREETMTLLEKRVFVLACLIAHEYPDHADDEISRVRILSRWLRGLDVDTDARSKVVRERIGAVSRLEGNRHLMDAFSGLIETRWRKLHFGHDAGKPENARPALVELAKTVVDAFNAGDADTRLHLAVTLRSILTEDVDWPETGAREPDEHVALRADLRKLRDVVRDQALDAFMKAPGVGIPLAGGRFKNHARRAAVGALMTLAVGTDPENAIKIAADVLPVLAERGALAAGRIVLNRVDDAQGKSMLRPMLMGFLAKGPRDWWQQSWNALAEEDRAAVPDEVVMGELRKAGNTSVAARAATRRPGCRAELIRMTPQLADMEQTIILSELDWKPEDFHGLTLEAMFTFREALEDAGGEDARRARIRLDETLRTGPWGDDIVKRLARPADHGDRAWLLRTIGPNTAVPWDRDRDPAADFWRTLHESRQGQSKAANTIRAWITEGEESGLADEDERLLWWALEPHLVALDLVHADDLDEALPEGVVRRTLLAATTDELMQVLQGTLDPGSDISGVQVLARLPETAATRLIDAALTLWKTDKDREACKTVIDRTPEPALAAALIRRAGTLPNHIALDVLKWWNRKHAAFEFASRAVTVHPDEGVRERAARLLYRETGEPRRWVDAHGLVHFVGPTTLRQRIDDLRKRAKRTGTAAVTSALASDNADERAAAHVVLSRWGLLLTK